MAIPTNPAFCGCCAGDGPVAPGMLFNRPALSTLDYRIETFGTFRAAMLQAIASEAALAGLTTRESDDYAITILELWAAVGDVLTFYQERYANEFFLRTAKERDSVLRLARMLDYHLRPGLAATTKLAFTLDAGAVTRIPVGLKVMSVPGQDERPQFFETTEEIEARAHLNRPRVFAPPVPLNALAQGRSAAPVIAAPAAVSPGNRLIFFTNWAAEEKTAVSLENGDTGRRLAWNPAIQAGNWRADAAHAAKVTRSVGFFGRNAPDSYSYYDANPAIPATQRWKTVTAGSPGYQMSLGAGGFYPLDTRYPDLAPGTLMLVDAGPGSPARFRLARVTETKDEPETLGQIQDSVTHAAFRQVIRDKPVAVSAGANRLTVFARSGTDAALTLNLDAGSASGIWQFRDGGILSAPPEATSSATGRVELFARGLDNALWLDVLSAGEWSGWSSLGGSLTSSPRAVSHTTDALHVFARGLDLGLWYRARTGGVWSSWLSLGGILTSEIEAVSWGANRIDAFVRGVDRALWRRYWNGAVWSAWESLGGTLASRSVAVARAPNRLDIFARDDSGAVIWKAWNGAKWSEWVSIGGPIAEEPAAASMAPDRIDLFALGPDSELKTAYWNGTKWSAWNSLGGNLASAPAVVRMTVSGVTQTHVFARAADDTLAELVWNGSAWTAWISRGDGLGSIPDRRKARIWQLEAPELAFQAYDYPARIESGRVVAELNDVPSIEKNRRIIVEDGVAPPHTATVTGTTPISAAWGGVATHLAIDFTPAPATPLASASAVLLGNVAEASHGETVSDEPLGNGDASKSFQRFGLRKSPLTHVPGTNSVEGASTLTLRVNGEAWTEVESLYAQPPTARVFTARQSDTGDTVLQFGDGRTGARLPTGQGNVVATYRQGLGLEGRMKANQLSILLARPVGLREVRNPVPAEGGADPEPLDTARETAPTTVKTFDRVVSLRDFEALLATSGLVAKSRATWVWRGLEKAVHLTVAAPGGGTLSADSLKTLHDALAAQRDINHRLDIANFCRVAIEVRAKIVPDPARVAEDVQAAARQALLDHFAFEAMPLGRPVHASDIFAVLQGAEGVVAVDLDVLRYKGAADWTPAQQALRGVTTALQQAHLRIFDARANADGSLDHDPVVAACFGDKPPAVIPAEQAWIEDPGTDTVLTLVDRLDQ